jgi:hypothetical protein
MQNSQLDDMGAPNDQIGQETTVPNAKDTWGPDQAAKNIGY